MLNHWIFLKSWLLMKKGKPFVFSLWFGVKLLTRLRLGFSHPNKFRHDFKDTLKAN